MPQQQYSEIVHPDIRSQEEVTQNSGYGERNLSAEQQAKRAEQEKIDLIVQDEGQLDQGSTSSASPPETVPRGWYLISNNRKLDTDHFSHLEAFRYTTKDGEFIPSQVPDTSIRAFQIDKDFFLLKNFQSYRQRIYLFFLHGKLRGGFFSFSRHLRFLP